MPFYQATKDVLTSAKIVLVTAKGNFFKRCPLALHLFCSLPESRDTMKFFAEIAPELYPLNKKNLSHSP